MNPIAREFAGRQLHYLEANQGRLVIDADTHITDVGGLSGELRRRYDSADDYYHGRPVSAEDVIREMDMAGVDAALIWQNPSATVYTDDPERNAESLLAANRYVCEAARRFPERFIPAGWTDPKACGLANALRMAEIFVREFGFAIVKMNPAQNAYPIDSPEVLAVVDRLASLGAVPAFHFGSDTPYTPAEGLERVALRHPDLTRSSPCIWAAAARPTERPKASIRKRGASGCGGRTSASSSAPSAIRTWRAT